MHKLASLNYQIKLASEMYLPAVSSAGFYGRSVFTTIAVYKTEIFQWEKHWRRLTENAGRIGIDLSDFSEREVEKSVKDLIAANSFQSGRIRLTVFDETTKGLWSLETKNNVALLITSADFRNFSGTIRLTISPFSANSKSPLCNLKSGNYLENILALEESQRRGFDEAVRLNEKSEVVSAVMANIFWIKNDQIYTPSLDTGALQGTTREFIRENFQVTEKTIDLAELKSAAEIFITSAGIGAAIVKDFEGRLFGDFNVSNSIQKIFKNFI